MKPSFISNRILRTCCLFFGTAGVLPIAVAQLATSPGVALRYSTPNGVPLPSGIQPIGSEDYLLAGNATLSRIDAAGSVEWGLWAAQGVRGTTTLKAHPEQPLVYAKVEGLADEEFWTVFGVFRADDGGRVFERGIRVNIEDTTPGGAIIPDTRIIADCFSDGRSTVILSGKEPRFALSLLDAEGQPQLQKTLAAPSFAVAGSQPRANLIEEPGKGFWFIAVGAQNLSDRPNPPIINKAVAVNVLRFGPGGNLVWSRKYDGLQMSAPPALYDIPAAIGSDGSVILTFTDTLTDLSQPSVTGFVAYVMALGPQGNLLWTRRIRNVAGGGVTPILSLDQSAVFLLGARLNTLAPLNVDPVLLKLDARTGESLHQVSIHPNTAAELSFGGISSNRIYVHALAYDVSSLPASQSYAGSFDLNLQNAVWKQLTNPGRVRLAYHPGKSSIMLSDLPTAGSALDVIELEADLNRVAVGSVFENAEAGCELLSAAPVAQRDPGLLVETVSITRNDLEVLTTDEPIALTATNRIELHRFTPSASELCQRALPSLRLSFSTGPDRSDFTLEFQSETGVRYEVLYTAEIDKAFQVIEEVTGDGTIINKRYDSRDLPGGFYRLRSVR